MNEEVKTRCNHCKCWRFDKDFLGKSKEIFKSCSTCREKYARRNRRPDIKEKVSNR